MSLRAKFVDRLMRILKGEKNADGIEGSLSGGSGRECRDLHKVDAAVKRALSDFGGIRVLADACAYERGRNPRAESSDPICEESRALIAASKRVGCFMDAEAVPGTRYSIRTGESEVRFLQSERVYYKVKDPFAKAHLKKHSARFALYEHIVHNILFPDCSLELIGVAEVMREARLVYRQKAVRSGDRPTDSAISEHLRRLGLPPMERYCFGNDFLFVTDVGQDSDNVLQGANGEILFIDPIVGFRDPLCSRLSENLDDNRIRTLVFDVLGVGGER